MLKRDSVARQIPLTLLRAVIGTDEHRSTCRASVASAASASPAITNRLGLEALAPIPPALLVGHPLSFVGITPLALCEMYSHPLAPAQRSARVTRVPLARTRLLPVAPSVALPPAALAPEVSIIEPLRPMP